MTLLKVGVRYGMNLVAMVARQEGYAAAAKAGLRFVGTETLKMPRFAKMVVEQRLTKRPPARHPRMYSDVILESTGGLGVEIQPYRVDVPRFWEHVRACRYPRNYAGGPMSEGGAR